MSSYIIKIDYIGVSASFLCLLHCLASPLVFITKASWVHYNDIAALWWTSLDYVFLSISLYAVFQISKIQNNSWILFTLWGSWIVLLLIILNEKVAFIELPEEIIYFPSVSLMLLHLYNLKYCTCKKDKCCTKGL
jgi:hypothetical protein